jgi:hypothetical protein
MTDHVLDIWKTAAPSLDLIAPDIYMSQYAQYEKVLDGYARKDNALFVPESGNAAAYPRYMFATLGHGAIGWSTFGLDLTGYANAPLGAPVVDDKLIDLFALNSEIVGPMQREIAKLNFAGKVQAVAEIRRCTRRTWSLGRGPQRWRMGCGCLGGRPMLLGMGTRWGGLWWRSWGRMSSW